MLITSKELEAELLYAIGLIRRKFNCGVGCHSLVGFNELADGYPGIEQAFEDTIRLAATLWGPPSKVAPGGATVDADLEGVPEDLRIGKALRYAYWNTSEVRACIAMVTHDADTCRNFDLIMEVRQS